MNLLKNLFGAIGKIFAAIFGIFGNLLPSGKGKGETFFLEVDDAKGVSTAPAAKPAKASKTTASPAAKPSNNGVASTLNLPQPTVKSSTAAAPAAPAYSQFGARRRPGANMKSYLDMAKTAKVPVR
jgi:hypothetical protein